MTSSLILLGIGLFGGMVGYYLIDRTHNHKALLTSQQLTHDKTTTPSSHQQHHNNFKHKPIVKHYKPPINDAWDDQHIEPRKFNIVKHLPKTSGYTHDPPARFYHKTSDYRYGLGDLTKEPQKYHNMIDPVGHGSQVARYLGSHIPIMSENHDPELHHYIVSPHRHDNWVDGAVPPHYQFPYMHITPDHRDIQPGDIISQHNLPEDRHFDFMPESI